MWSLDGALQDFISDCRESGCTHDELIEVLEKAVRALQDEKKAAE